ncbi:MAG TPA: peptidyl-alpha-hydroxyglycine alpha-amidating lyase family protein [Candidatus Sulfopaludibacter sp.]|nr:peptidyl-alpha-hydroxyglycine alpha-amidating lyase family protein [Candidatus Sulfopaludibacter sp.]
MRFILTMAAAAAAAFAQADAPPNSQPNPYRTIDHWGKMPEGRTWGSTSSVGVDRDGNIWVAERCGANSCAGKTVPPVLKFDPSGNLLKSFGENMFVFPHDLVVDRQGNIWVVDGQGREGKGHQVIKFDPNGKVLLTLGKAGVAGADENTFNQPSAVAIAPNGDIFVADGHGGNTNARIVKFNKDGKFLKTWGKKGAAPGDFDTPHCLAFDSKGRLFVGDRANNRIQIFDQEGRFLEEWKQFSRPSGLYIDSHDVIYVSDSESREREGYGHHPGWKRGIRVGSAKDGTVTAFIPDTFPTPEDSATSGSEGVAADAMGSIFGAEVRQMGIQKYVK